MTHGRELQDRKWQTPPPFPLLPLILCFFSVPPLYPSTAAAFSYLSALTISTLIAIIITYSLEYLFSQHKFLIKLLFLPLTFSTTPLFTLKAHAFHIEYTNHLSPLGHCLRFEVITKTGMKKMAQNPRLQIQLAKIQRSAKDLSRRSLLTLPQVCQNLGLIILLRMIFVDLLLSHSNPLSSLKLYSGYYIRPNALMNVRHTTPFFFSQPFTLMAFNLPENSLILRESEAFELEDELAPELNQALNLTLAGKLLATNPPSLSNLTYFVSKTWECPNRLKAYDYGGGLYSFEFVLDSDVLRVIEGGLWYMDGKLMLIQRINPNTSINRLVFESTKLWVRCFDLPPKAYNIKFAKAFGNMLGCFCDSDLQEKNGETAFNGVSRLPTVRKYLRMKVTINLAEPLKCSQCFKIRNSVENKVEEFTARLAYERLFLFC